MAAEDPRVGSVLHGRYRLVERFTAGSMGVVYRAERVGLGRGVAVKVLHESYAATDDGRRRFEVEARAMSRLSHPNCVGVMDFGVVDGAPYLVMDFVTGWTLREVIRAEGRLAPVRAVRIVRQIVAGLAHAHGQGIVHRDVKPENVIVSRIEGGGEQVNVIDFGLAKLRGNKSVTTGVALGTPGYMSPEQTIGRSVDNRADVYAVGIILFELLVGQKPFQGPDPFELMRMHREVPVPRLAQAAPGVGFSPKLEAVVQRALAKAPEDRFATMEELAYALDDTPEGQGQRGVSRRGAVLIGLGAAGLVAAIAIAMWPSAGGGEPRAGMLGVAPAPTTAAPRPDAAPAPAPAEIAVDAAEPAIEVEPDVLDGEAEDVATQRDRAAAGELGAAVRELEALREREPQRADVHYALGNLYIEQQSWPAAVSSYGAAIALDPAYVEDERLIADVVEALANNRSHKAAARLLTSQIGAPALPRLEEAMRSSNRRLRERARRVHNQIDR